MVAKKLFTLAGVTALSGLVFAVTAAGCSSGTTVFVTGEGGPGVSEAGRADAPATGDATITDARRKETEPDPDLPETGNPNCWEATTIPAAGLPFKTPTAPVANACTQADLVAMEKAVDANNNITLADLKAAVAASCQACAFGDASAATWAPVVLNATVGGKTTDLGNVGGCMAYLSGSDPCGKTYADWSDCLDTACRTAACEADQTSGTACYGAKGAVNDACKAQTQSLVTACGANVDTNVTACQNAGKACTTCGGTSGSIKYVFEEAIVVQCVKAPPPT